ncbi:unnamed protein product [Rotaria sp. Silwood2]|nr:unnamed protein product [Rotaria sp. Silwood2]CAF4331446.1 unnamed protein product [Rotaria sp. Silwood2]
MHIPHLFLDQLPVEIIFDIFTYLTTIEILHSFYSFSRYLRQCIRSYQQYKINFTSISKNEFDRICNVIRPDQMMALALSDDEETPGQVTSFFARFPRFEQTFTRLEYLYIRNFQEFPSLSHMTSLHTIAIDFIRWPIYSFEYAHIQQFDDKLATICRLPTLRALVLNKKSLNIRLNFNTFFIGEHLNKFQIHLRTIDNLPFIFKCVPNIQRLTISLNTTSVDNDFSSRFNVPHSLTHLTIKVSFGLRNEIQHIIQSCFNLMYLNIHIERNQTDTYQWLDGNWWQSLIDEFLPQLKMFRLRIDLNSSLDLSVTKDLLKSFQTTFWTNNEGRYRSFIIGVMSAFDTLPIDCKQQIISNKTLCINLSSDDSPILPENRASNVELLTLEHATPTNEYYTVSNLIELERYINNLSTLVHLKLDDTCAMTSSVLTQLLNIAPRLTRLTISSFHNHMRRLFDLTYPQIRWLDMRRGYLPGKSRTTFCSVFPCLKHLLNCYLYSEEDFEVLIENLQFLQNLTVHIQTYYFDSNDELKQWLMRHTHLKNFTFKLINERQILLWIGR